MSGAGPTFRPYRPGDEAALAALFTRVFGRPLTPAMWLWKVRSRPFAVPTVWVGEADGAIVFQTAGIPLRAHVAGEEVDAIVAVDAMTAPEWRRRGLLAAGTRMAYDAWREAGVAFVMGLPNEQWGSRAAALGWMRLFPLAWLVRPLRPERTAARKLGLPFTAGLAPLGNVAHGVLGRRLPRRPIAVRHAEPDDPAIGRIGEALSRSFPVVPGHDAAWATWRFCPPGDSYRILVVEDGGFPRGWAAYHRREDDLHLVELRALPEDLPVVLRSLLERWRDGGVEKVTTLAAPGSALHAHLRRAGFLRARRPFSFEVVPLRDGLPFDLLRDPAAWWLTGADFDVI
jgi:hypothetical protein